MKYMGSKNRIAKHILPIMLNAAEEKNITTWVEPFVGGGNIIDKVPNNFTRLGYDINPHTINALVAIKSMVYELPETVSEIYYNSLKGTEPSPITSWIRFHCSFSGKFEGGYAKNNRGVNYCMEGRKNTIAQSNNLQGTYLFVGNYSDVKAINCLIYCDPPYKLSTQYKTGTFDHDKFWQWCRDMSKKNVVFVSEYEAPDDFTCVWQGEVKTNFASKRSKATHNAVEKLFRLK